MQPIQWSEPFARLRRLTRTVGQQTAVLEEVVSPNITLANVDRPPYRSEPRKFIVSALKGLAGVDPNFALISWGAATSPATAKNGAIVIDLVRVALLTRPDVTQVVEVDLILTRQTVNGPGASLRLVEPVTNTIAGGNIFGALPATISTGEVAAVGITPTIIDTQSLLIAAAAAYGVHGTFTFGPGLNIELLPPALTGADDLALGVQVQGTSSAGANNISMRTSFHGDYFLEYPQR